MLNVHKTAIIEEGAQVGKNVSIGPYSIIGPNVVLHDDVVIKSHVVIEGHTTIGSNTTIYQFASIGSVTQDLKYKGEKSELIIGKNNIIREYVTMNPGTDAGTKTIVGNNCLFMVSAHVAHDCIVGDYVIFANNATIGGHAEVDDYAILGGLSAVVQFTKVGKHAMLGGMSLATTDVPPYAMVMTDPAKIDGINLVGLKRREFTKQQIKNLKDSYEILFSYKTLMAESIKEIESNFEDCTAVQHLLDFLKLERKKGLVKHKNFYSNVKT
jgi:UDP-N-acetylglucosamine acyltransferase